MSKKRNVLTRSLDLLERAGNKLPDPALLFLILMLTVWVLSAWLSALSFSEIDPRTGAPLIIKNLLTGPSLAEFLSGMVTTFTGFAPLNIVLMAMLRVGVAEHSGFISAGIRILLGITARQLLTPMLVLVAIISHTATDAGYVVVIPLGGVIFYAAGRHPLAGIAAAFAGVSGGFSANFIPSSIDPLLQGFTQSAARILDPDIQINPLNNWFFTAMSSFLIIGLGWYLTDKVVEPRLKRTIKIDENTDAMHTRMDPPNKAEKKAFLGGMLAMMAGILLLILWVLPSDSAMRSPDGEIVSFTSPLMRSIVPLLFILFIIPGLVYGYMIKTYKTSSDFIKSMTTAMQSMGYYIVLAFFCSLFIDAFGKSNIGALLALKGAANLKALALPAGFTVVGLIFLTAFINLFVGSASAKWALIGPIMVPMLMQLNISPDLTQAGYRIGDSSSNIITPLMPYFPLVVVFCQRYVKNTGIGTLVSMMLPYSVTFLIFWTLFLLLYWFSGIPLGLQSNYVYP